MDTALPVARALAIAGDRIAGGVGTHETALASPDRVDLGGRCVLPGFSDSHVHFPTWSLAQDAVRLEETRSLEEAVARVRDALAGGGQGWLRGRGWRSGDWSPAVEPTRHDLDAITGERPVALEARDSHSLWLNSAALALANGDLQVPGGVVEERLRLGYVKVFMDGTLGSQTAHMLDGSGVEITTREELEDVIRRAATRRFPVAVHAIGDRANRNALDAFEATQDAWRPLGLRPRIEHAQLLAAEDLPRFAQLGVAASVQFSHAPSDRDLADTHWVGKTAGAYAFRSLLDSRAVVANGSDAPIEELDPWAGVCAGVLRTIDGRPAWHPEQRVTLEQALLATCVTPAWLSGDERRRGKLLPGYLADLVVLDRDPFELEPEELPSVEVVATMLGGRWVHNPPPWD